MSSNIKKIIFLFLLSFLLRVLFGSFSGLLTVNDFRDDEAKYFEAVKSISKNGTFEMHGKKTSWHSPGFSFILSIFYKIGFSDILSLRVINIIFGSLIPILVYIFLNLLGQKKYAFLSSLFTSFYPAYIYWNQYLLTEIFFSLAILVLSFVIFNYQRFPSSKNAVITGIVLGLVSYVRPVGIIMLPIIIIWLFLVNKMPYKKSKIFFSSFIIIFFFFITVLPWSLRNYELHNKIIPMNSNGGVNLLQGNNPVSWDENNPMRGALTYYENESLAIFFPEGQLGLLSQNKEIELDSIASARALDFIKSNFNQLPLIAISKIIKMYKIYPYGASLIEKVGLCIFYLPILFFSLFGIIRIIYNHEKYSFLLIPIISTTASCVIFYGMPRLRLPIDSLLIIIATLGFSYFIDLINSKFGNG